MICKECGYDTAKKEWTRFYSDHLCWICYTTAIKRQNEKMGLITEDPIGENIQLQAEVERLEAENECCLNNNKELKEKAVHFRKQMYKKLFIIESQKQSYRKKKAKFLKSIKDLKEKNSALQAEVEKLEKMNESIEERLNKRIAIVCEDLCERDKTLGIYRAKARMYEESNVEFHKIFEKEKEKYNKLEEEDSVLIEENTKLNAQIISLKVILSNLIEYIGDFS